MSTNPAIITTYKGPTATRGARIVAAGGYGRGIRVAVPYDHALSATQNHAAAAAEFIGRRHGERLADVVSADVRPGVMAHLITPGVETVHVTPCCPIDCGGLTALVVDDGGIVIAEVRANANIDATQFHSAMRQLDASYDENEWGHG